MSLLKKRKAKKKQTVNNELVAEAKMGTPHNTINGNKK